MEKKLPTLPDNIAKEYEALVVPTTVIVQKPKRKVYDMTRITKEQAKELEGKYLAKKEKAEPKTNSK